MTTKKILAISGSTRKNSSNESILKHIAFQYKDSLMLKIYQGIDQLPHFNPDLDNDSPPRIVATFRNEIETADAVIICTPEYVFSLPGALKNAIEWTVSTTLFSNKPVAFIVAAASGEKAFESLDLIMTTIEANMNPDAKLLIQGVKGKIGSDGSITDQITVDKITTLVNSLVNNIS